MNEILYKVLAFVLILYIGIEFILLITSFFSSKSSLIKHYNTINKLKRMPWQKFEHLCMELFSHYGWSVKGHDQTGADGGVDIWMYKRRLFFFKTKAIVQCKRYANTYVGVSVVREMYGLKYEYGVDEVYIVTTSGFTKDSYDFAKNKKIFLININELIKLINNIV